MIAVAILGVLVIAGGASAATKYLITSINQIKPSVRAQISALRIVTAYGPTVVLGTGNSSIQSSVAVCQRGTVVAGGGWYGSNLPAIIATSAPDGNGWLVVMQADSTEKQSFQAVARCESR
jgi:hypothetical protein